MEQIEPGPASVGRNQVGRLVFVIDVVEGRTLRIRLTNFWTEAVFGEFVASYRASLATLECAPGQHQVLCDASCWPVQHREIAERFRNFIDATPFAISTRMAVVCGSALLRMQVERIAGRPNLGIFSHLIDAKKWLLA